MSIAIPAVNSIAGKVTSSPHSPIKQASSNVMSIAIPAVNSIAGKVTSSQSNQASRTVLPMQITPPVLSVVYLECQVGIQHTFSKMYILKVIHWLECLVYGKDIS
uniref:Uncharacterized protein n=1 Tax=Cacopsylla melanoneura TaxID=428564 RepID=A0A8D8ZFU8_9HEMI